VFDKRLSRGEVTVEHIMVSNNQVDSTLVPEVRINEIYKKIEQGENFESLAKQFSDDKSSSSKGGLLPAFTGGQLSSQEFEDVAFGLK
jgi:peptidyl-prolyl cis-trans isomerase SurA